MNQQEFDETLRRFLRQTIVPLVVELLDGRRIVMSEPSVVFDAGAALYVSDTGFERFVCEDVRAMYPLDDRAANSNERAENLMSPQQIEEKLCQLKHRKPFVPFVVELKDGQLLEVQTRGIAINGGGATFFGGDGALVDFEFVNVGNIRLLTQEPAA